jgi:hypothetical protein
MLPPPPGGRRTLKVFKHVLEERCGRFRPNATTGANTTATAAAGAAPPGLPPLVVDIGANFGFFTAYAAAMGCRWVVVL